MAIVIRIGKPKVLRPGEREPDMIYTIIQLRVWNHNKSAHRIGSMKIYILKDSIKKRRYPRRYYINYN